tara:strand:- start:333 stop:506 length:174 start_codon:yes stop_codon:yes gene_type:complete
MIQADYLTWFQTVLFPFMPVICIFIASSLLLDDLRDDDDDDDGGGGVMTPVYSYNPT